MNGDLRPMCCSDVKRQRYWDGYSAALDDLIRALGRDLDEWIVEVRAKFELPASVASGEGST